MNKFVKLTAVAAMLALPSAAAAKAKCVWEEDLGEYVDNPDSCYRNGKRHGRWELRWADGEGRTGPYVNGKRHGRWELRHANGGGATGPFVKGIRHGRWEVRYANGMVATGPYVNGIRHGRWEERTPGGKAVQCETYKNGVLDKDSFTPGACE